MPTYVIGDVQGCFLTLERLLTRIPFDPAKDRLWLAGDLVNRGPRSLEVLRWAVGQPGLVTVLGNHDLHLLSRAAGVRKPKPRDTLDGILSAPDREALLHWVRTRPFMHREGPWMMVHAGLLPAWDAAEAEGLARELEAALRGPDGTKLLADYTEEEGPDRWKADLDPAERRLVALKAFTILRTLDKDGDMDLEYSGSPSSAPRGQRPWFEAAKRRWAGEGTVLFGHWAALGLHLGDDAIGLDTACVWGGTLTAIRLEDRAIWQEPNRD